ncbi:mucin-5AC-like [Penaeus japonicus]|uniref:mucin-5AC-like n=1 Tax=Penaeus japonicus TaxID=27405 RepID=UPI001C716075|nr:mucin-5AC-like [Penaeus japonicus]
MTVKCSSWIIYICCHCQRVRCTRVMLLLSVCLQAAATPLHVVIAPQGSVRGVHEGQSSESLIRPVRGHVLVRRAATDEEDMTPRESRGLLTSLFRPFFGGGGGGGGGNRERNGGRGGHGGRETPALPRPPLRPIGPPRAAGPPSPNGSPQHIFIPIHDHNIVKFPGIPQPPTAPAPPRAKTTEEADPGLVYNFADPSEFSEPRPEDVINGDAEGGYITLSPAPVFRPTPPISLEPPPYPFDVLKPPQSPPPHAFRFPGSESTNFHPPANSHQPSKIRFPVSDSKVNSQQFGNPSPNINSHFTPPQVKPQNKETHNNGPIFPNSFPPTRFPQNEVNSVSHEPTKSFKDSHDFFKDSNINNFPIPTGSQFSEPLLPNDSDSLIPFEFGDDFFITGGLSETGSISGSRGVSYTGGISGTGSIADNGGISSIGGTSGTGSISHTSNTFGTGDISGNAGIPDNRDVFGTSGVPGAGGVFGTGGASFSTGTSGTEGISDTRGTSGAGGDISATRDEYGTNAGQLSYEIPQSPKPTTSRTTSLPSIPQQKENPISYQIQSWRLPSPEPTTTQLPPVVRTETPHPKAPRPWTTAPPTTKADYVSPQIPVAVQQNQIPEQVILNPVSPSSWPATPHREQNPTPAPPHWLHEGTSGSRFETTTSQQSPQTPSQTPQVITENPWPNSGHQSPQSIQGNFVEDTHVKKRENKVPPSTHTFDPLPAFSAEDLGPSGSTSQGFFPYQNSDDFFNEVFKNSNPFGAKIVTEVTPSSNRFSTAGTFQESQVQTSRTGLPPQLSAESKSASTPSLKTLPSTSSPPRTQTYQISIRPSLVPASANNPLNTPHSAATSFTHQQLMQQNVLSPSTSSSQPFTTDPFTSLLSNHQLASTSDTKFVPVRSFTSAPQSSSSRSSTRVPASFQSPPLVRGGPGGPSSNYQGVSNLLANNVQRHIVPSSRGPSTTSNDHQQFHINNNHVEESNHTIPNHIEGSNPFNSEEDITSSQSYHSHSDIHGRVPSPLRSISVVFAWAHPDPQDNAPSASTTTTTIASLPDATEGKIAEVGDNTVEIK